MDIRTAIAERLVDQLQQNFSIPSLPNRKDLVSLIVKSKIPVEEEFVTLDPDYKIVIGENLPYSIITISHILSNDRFGRRMNESLFFTSYYGWRGDLKKLAKENKLISLMSRTVEHFSLFGNYEHYQYLREDDNFVEADRMPMLIVADGEHQGLITDWQNKNIKHTEESEFGLPRWTYFTANR